MNRRGTQLIITSAAACVAVMGMALAIVDPHDHRPHDGPLAITIEVVLFVGGLSLIVAGGWWWRRRLQNRMGVLMVALGLSAALLQASYYAGPSIAADLVRMTSVLASRPLIGWLLLGWPSGRLRSGDRRALLVYTVGSIALGLPGWLLAEQAPYAPLVIYPMPALANACGYIGGFVLFPVGAVALFITLLRRRRSLPAAARPSLTPAVVAAGAAFVGDGIANAAMAFINTPLETPQGITWYGFVRALLDLGRFLAIGVALGWGAWRRVRRAPATAVRQVDIGSGEARPSINARLATQTGDAAAAVLFPKGDGWIDSDGQRVDDHPRLGRTRTRIERDRTVVAALDLDSLFDDRPAALEAAAGSVASTVDHARLQALATERLEQARRARLAVLDAEDSTRRRLERDLHDGAQQRLVGLALHARLAAQSAPIDEASITTLVDGLAAARAELETLAAGVMPTAIAEIGFTRAVHAIAATAPIGVSIAIDLPDDLPPATAAAAWFVITEAVTNAVKHADARRVSIDASVANGLLELRLCDDGSGGADLAHGSGLVGLRDRVESAGGRFALTSPVGHGTTIAVSLPLATTLPTTPGSRPSTRLVTIDALAASPNGVTQ